MKKLETEQNVKIIAYCVMNNHVHMLIESEKPEELSKYMQRLNTTYAIFYNNKYNRVGYVFRSRFKSEIIYNESHCYNCIKYIYDNPVKAGICSNPIQYPYSNYKEMKIKLNINTMENYQFIDIQEKKEKYCEEFLKEQIKEYGDLRQNPEILLKTILTLRKTYNLSLRNIAKILEVNREKIRKLYQRDNI